LPRQVYFLNGGVCSSTTVLSNGGMVEAATIGDFGFVGVEACLSVRATLDSPARAVGSYPQPACACRFPASGATRPSSPSRTSADLRDEPLEQQSENHQSEYV